MGDYGHVTAWSGVRAGREKAALDLFGDAVDFYEKAKANSQISDYEVVLYQPTGSALPLGVITLWGTEDEIDAIDRNQDRVALQMRAGLLCEGLVQSRCVRGAAVLEGMGTYQAAIDKL